jgi:ketosteroid isomerase-like protein
MGATNLDLVRRGFEDASRGDLDAIAAILAQDVRWHAAGDEEGGCQNRDQALRWMGEALARGIGVDLIEARELPGDRVLTILQRQPTPDEAGQEPPPPHGQILSFRDGRIVEIVVYPAAEEALAAA